MADPKLFLAILVSLIIAVSSQSTCRWHRCPPGTKCGYIQVACVRAPCNAVRTCITRADPRCPAVRPGRVGVCAEWCPSSGCPTGQACCYNGCGHVCKRILPTLPDAIRPDAIRPAVRPAHADPRCPALRPATVGECAELCVYKGCPTGQACCFNGCGHVCTSILPTCQFTAICSLRMHCPYGFKEIREGCTICRCKPKCPPIKCLNVCPLGTAKDRNGCNTCRCKTYLPTRRSIVADW